MRLNRLAFFALALIAPLSGITSTAYAQPDPVERKLNAVTVLSLVQIVSLDMTARTINVRTPKTSELLGEPSINIGQYETITIPLSPKVELKQMHNEAHCDCSFPIGLKEIDAALKENRHISVDFDTTNKDEKVEVKQLTVFTKPQKTLEQRFKELLGEPVRMPRK